MQRMGDSLRKIAAVWEKEYGLGQLDAKTVQRILRHIGQEALRAIVALSAVSDYRNERALYVLAFFLTLDPPV